MSESTPLYDKSTANLRRAQFYRDINYLSQSLLDEIFGPKPTKEQNQMGSKLDIAKRINHPIDPDKDVWIVWCPTSDRVPSQVYYDIDTARNAAKAVIKQEMGYGRSVVMYIASITEALMPEEKPIRTVIY